MLRKIPLLEGIDAVQLERLRKCMWGKQYERKEFVVHKGTQGDSLLFLLSGNLQVVDFTEDGRQIGLNLLTEGDFFGELTLIDNLPRSASIYAMNKAVVAFLVRDAARELIFNTPLVAERVLTRMARSVRVMSEFRALLAIVNVNQRVFALLQLLMKTTYGGFYVIEQLPTRQEMAIMINTSRETVSRAIAWLVDEGIVEKDMKRLIVRQPNKLQRMALEGVVESLQ